MKRALVSIVPLALVFLTGCSFFSSSRINAEVLERPLENIAARHDAYVRADESLAPEQKEIYLTTSQLVRQIVQEALGKETPDE